MRALLSLAVVCSTVAVAQPVRAGDDVAFVTSSIAGAAQTVTSFVVQTTINGTTGVTGTLTFVRPQRVKLSYTLGAMSVESYLVDGVVYIHAGSGEWHKMNVDALQASQQTMNVADQIKSAKVTLLPDRQEDGTTVGVMQVGVQLPAAAGPVAPGAVRQDLICSYDKTSYRLRVCANDVATMTYSHYNDPANSVVLPAAAKDAAPMSPPFGPPPAAGTPLPAPAPASSPAG